MNVIEGVFTSNVSRTLLNSTKIANVGIGPLSLRIALDETFFWEKFQNSNSKDGSVIFRSSHVSISNCIHRLIGMRVCVRARMRKIDLYHPFVLPFFLLSYI